MSQLNDKREAMIDFLLENISAGSIERRGSDIVYSADNEYYIKTVSRQSDLPFDFRRNPGNFDEDRRRLNAIKGDLLSMIDDKNKQGFVPGFVFLRSNADYSQLKKRLKYKVNDGFFLKQMLPTRSYSNPWYDKKWLDPLEIVMMQFHRHNSINQEKKAQSRNLTYQPELYYYNPKEADLEVVWFAEIFRNVYKNDNCPVCCPICGENNRGGSHMLCKNEPAYLKYVIDRNHTRYAKAIKVNKKRHALKGKSQWKKRIQFTPAELLPNISEGKDIMIALVV